MIHPHAVRLISAYILVLTCGAWPALALETQPEEKSEKCVYPDPYALMGGEFAGLDRAEYMFTGNARIRWLFISFGGPPDGEVFVLSCNGHVLAKRELGFVERYGWGPELPSLNTAEVWFIPNSGTGINDHSVALLVFDGKSIRILWDHAVDDSATEPAYLFDGKPQSNGMRTDEQTYHWEYGDRDEKIIKVTGRETRSTGIRTIRRTLPPEKYCFDASKLKYVRCR